MEPQVAIYLTTPEALMFKDFQKFHETFALLVSKGVFDIKSGSATIHFDSQGEIALIERNDRLYNRRT
jgi:hypothetical protein